jgi:pilus assembly protein CpaB
LKIAANAPAGDAAQDLTRAAAGVALDQLSGSAGNTGGHPQPAPRIARSTTRVAGATNDGIEVIRGGRAETVAR